MTTRFAPAPSSRPGAPAPEQRYLVCEECDAVYPGQAIANDAVLRCRRCGATLERGHALPLNGQLGLTLGALTVFLIGSLSPIVTLELKGNHSQASLLEATRLTWESGAHLVALLSAATAFVFPMLVILLRLWVLVPLLLRRPVPLLAPVMRLQRLVLRWSMVEVFMLGVLVSLVKLAHIAGVVPGIALWSFGALMLVMAAIAAVFDPRALWAEMSAAR